MAGFYSSPDWEPLRQATFLRDGYRCQWPGCGCFVVQGNDKPNSAIADHIKPHKGIAVLFFNPDNLQTLCKSCHDGPKQAFERKIAKGEQADHIGNDGWPIDPNHIANQPVQLIKRKSF